MKEAAVQSADVEDALNSQQNLLLDTLVAAHYLALQMGMLTDDETFRGRAATDFLAQALSEWARMVENDLFDDAFFGAQAPQARPPEAQAPSGPGGSSFLHRP
jgi:hypothetical protein